MRVYQLFVPVARVYGLSDAIPFHVQLSGSLNSIRSFLMLSQADGPSPSPVLRPSNLPQTTVRVYLLRHVSIDIRGYKSSRNTIIAEAQLREIPPTTDSCYESPDIVHLDWEGELSCSEDIIVGGFTTSNIVMKVTRHGPDIVNMLLISLDSFRTSLESESSLLRVNARHSNLWSFR